MKSKRLINTKNLLIAFAAFLFTSCGGGQQGPGAGARQQTPALPVLDLQKRAITLTTTYPASLEGQQTVEVRPRVQGYITAMPVDEGDLVSKGQVLFRLNNEQYEQAVRSAEADIKAAQAGVQTAEDEVERIQSLVDKDIVSKYRLQSAENSLETRKSELAQAQASLENAKVNLGYTNVKSPVNGTIGTIPYRIGSLVSSQSQKPLTTVSDISKMYAYFSMSERELLNMSQSVSKEGGNTNLQQQVQEMPKVNLLLSDDTVYEHQGTVRLASGMIDSQTGSASFRAVFPNPNEVLRSGASGQVQIPYKYDSVIAVPKKATYEVQNKIFVYTLTDSNSVESTPISVQSLSTKSLYVVSDGLNGNNKIVLSGMGSLKDGAKIKPQPVDADSLYQSLTEQNQSADTTSDS